MEAYIRRLKRSGLAESAVILAFGVSFKVNDFDLYNGSMNPAVERKGLY